MRSSLALAFSLSLLVSAVACAPDQSVAIDDGVANELGEEKVITEMDQGVVRVRAGDSFTIALNEGDGYEWEVDSEEDILGPPTESVASEDPQRPEAWVAKKFTWSTKASYGFYGMHTIALRLRRANRFPPKRRFGITIDIYAGEGDRPCGRGAGTCLADQYCYYGNAEDCGYGGAGVCRPKPQYCSHDVYKPVCGCNGVDYDNECFASAAGVPISGWGGACY